MGRPLLSICLTWLVHHQSIVLIGAYSKEKLQEGYSSFILEGSGQMKQLANQNGSEKEFQVGEFVYLNLQPYR